MLIMTSVPIAFSRTFLRIFDFTYTSESSTSRFWLIKLSDRWFSISFVETFISFPESSDFIFFKSFWLASFSISIVILSWALISLATSGFSSKYNFALSFPYPIFSSPYKYQLPFFLIIFSFTAISRNWPSKKCSATSSSISSYSTKIFVLGSCLLKRENDFLFFTCWIESSSTSVASVITSGSFNLFLLIFSTNNTANILMIIISK